MTDEQGGGVGLFSREDLQVRCSCGHEDASKLVTEQRGDGMWRAFTTVHEGGHMICCSTAWCVTEDEALSQWKQLLKSNSEI